MITFQNVFYKYDDNTNLLNNVNIQLDTDRYALRGEDFKNSKSLFLKLIAKLEKCQQGNIFLDFTNISVLDMKDKNMAYLSKEDHFFKNKTVYKNLEYIYNIRKVYDNYKEKIERAMEKFGIIELRDIKIKNLTEYQKILVALCRISLRNLRYFIIEDDIFTNQLSENKIKYIVEKIEYILNINEEITFICNTENSYVINQLKLKNLVYDNGTIKI